MKTETIEVNGRKYPVKIHYEDRKDSTVSIGKTAITIHLPLCMSREEISREELKLKAWARKKLLENPERHMPKAAREYKDGETLKVGNEEYLLKIELKEKESSSARAAGNNIHLVISSKLPKEVQDRHISTLLSRVIARKRLPLLKEKINAINNQHFNQSIKKIFFKNNKSSWGSCSEKGNINISTRLLFAPDDILEYVCVHELAHFIEFNHSERFWELVEKAMHGYKEKEEWLKQNRDTCRF
ncbi:MAG: DUF45 domain-containing protein [Nanoarchaeota archaeon]|nr:DUF45 domain-containing protein [Nanoarchaeota archaeon]